MPKQKHDCNNFDKYFFVFGVASLKNVV